MLFPLHGLGLTPHTGIPYSNVSCDDPSGNRDMWSKCRLAGIEPTGLPVVDVYGQVTWALKPLTLRLLRLLLCLLLAYLHSANSCHCWRPAAAIFKFVISIISTTGNEISDCIVQLPTSSITFLPLCVVWLPSVLAVHQFPVPDYLSSLFLSLHLCVCALLTVLVSMTLCLPAGWL